ncbi:hypothetical protein [Noviherbaspirillum soli]|uniref:hypothetical protein n=1 Tax=Noviherbaspirillum soli TaxID=1064518 RepID=UPI00188DC137|nr:hypothetical protein [Noviherbaspirillum soli]
MMKRLPIDFAPHSPATALARMGVPALITLALGIGIFLYGALQAVRCVGILRQQAAHLQTLRQQTERRPAIAAPAEPVPIPASQAAAVNRAVRQLNLPWRDVFDALEAASRPGLALLALESKAGAHVFKGVAESKEMEDMLAYIDRLKQQQLVRSAVLTRHETNEREPGKPIRFHFEVQWKTGP